MLAALQEVFQRRLRRGGRVVGDGRRADRRLVVAEVEQEAEVRAESRLGDAVAAFAAAHVHLGSLGRAGLRGIGHDVVAILERVAAESGTAEVVQEGV